MARGATRFLPRWLVQQNVTVMINDVKWAQRLYSKPKSKYSHFSHLYSSPDLMIGTLQRIDLPMQKELLQYNYVLYTDADVMFTQPIYWTDFPLPLPETIIMGFEADPIVPCNAGVMLVNMVNMRRTYPALLEHALSNEDMYWPGYECLLYSVRLDNTVLVGPGMAQSIRERSTRSTSSR